MARGSRRRPAPRGVRHRFGQHAIPTQPFVGVRWTPAHLRARPCQASPVLIGAALWLQKACKHPFRIIFAFCSLFAGARQHPHHANTPPGSATRSTGAGGVGSPMGVPCRAPHHDLCHLACQSFKDEWRHLRDRPFFYDGHRPCVARAIRVAASGWPLRSGFAAQTASPAMHRLSTSQCSDHCATAHPLHGQWKGGWRCGGDGCLHSQGHS